MGRHLVEKLLDRGYSVSVFDIRQSYELPGVTFYQGDLCDKQVRLLFQISEGSKVKKEKKMARPQNIGLNNRVKRP